MHRQQVLKYHLSDRFVTACVRFQKKLSRCKPVFMRVSAKCDRCDSFFQVLKIFRKNQNNKQNSKNLTHLSRYQKSSVFMRV